MQVKEVMSSMPEFLSADATIAETARSMREMNTGFVPIAENDQIIGIVTDRDLVLRAMADGKSLDDKIRSIKTPKVLYCAEDDDVKEVLKNMEEQHVQRLIVLNNRQDKDCVGVVTLADIADRSEDPETNKCIVDCCRHYH
jgi:CBS domain-containing protein